MAKSKYLMCTIPSSGFISVLGMQAPVLKPVALTEKQIKDTRALGFRVDLAEPELQAPVAKVEEVVETKEEAIEAPELVVGTEAILEELDGKPELPELTDEEAEAPRTAEISDVVEEPVEETQEEAPAETTDEEAPAETTDEEAPAETTDEEAPEPEVETPTEETETVEEDTLPIHSVTAIRKMNAEKLHAYATEVAEALDITIDITKNKTLIGDAIIEALKDYR